MNTHETSTQLTLSSPSRLGVVGAGDRFPAVQNDTVRLIFRIGGQRRALALGRVLQIRPAGKLAADFGSVEHEGEIVPLAGDLHLLEHGWSPTPAQAVLIVAGALGRFALLVDTVEGIDNAEERTSRAVATIDPDRLRQEVERAEIGADLVCA